MFRYRRFRRFPSVLPGSGRCGGSSRRANYEPRQGRAEQKFSSRLRHLQVLPFKRFVYALRKRYGQGLGAHEALESRPRSAGAAGLWSTSQIS